jgi:hypothetical protein
MESAMNNMERTTVMLPRDLKEQASEAAQAQHISVGELIRESLREKILKSKKGRTGDPFFSDTGIFVGSAPVDLADAHDDYLYGKKP